MNRSAHLSIGDLIFGDEATRSPGAMVPHFAGRTDRQMSCWIAVSPVSDRDRAAKGMDRVCDTDAIRPLSGSKKTQPEGCVISCAGGQSA